MIYSYNIINHLSGLILLLFIPMILLSLIASQKTMLSVMKSTALVITLIFMWSIFAQWTYSPQRMFLRLENKGGKTVTLRINKKKCSDINIIPSKAYLIYKGNYMEYFTTKKGVTGINKNCFY